MLKNYFTVALRNLVRHKAYSVINITGLGCGLLIFLFVQYERSYDRFHRNADRIHRAVYQSKFGDQTNEQVYCPPGLAESLK
ncbi:MAG: hypothetical protein IAF08_01640 [Rhizobacter sp.]|nr:hypothetical protein [Chlorobiales bacterium]